MEPESGEFEPNREVDEVRWLNPARRGRPADLRARQAARPGDRVNRDRFPGLSDGWARLDGPGGTQMVDYAIDAMTEWMHSGRTANEGGAFPHARASEEVVVAARDAVGRRPAPTRAASPSGRA